MPSTIVQKMTGLIIILIRLTNSVPRIAERGPDIGRHQAHDHACDDRHDHRDVEPVCSVTAMLRVAFGWRRGHRGCLLGDRGLHIVRYSTTRMWSRSQTWSVAAAPRQIAGEEFR